MAEIYTNPVIACASILLAAVILGLAPGWRRSFFAVVFGSGALATVAGVIAAIAG